MGKQFLDQRNIVRHWLEANAEQSEVLQPPIQDSHRLSEQEEGAAEMLMDTSTDVPAEITDHDSHACAMTSPLQGKNHTMNMNSHLGLSHQAGKILRSYFNELHHNNNLMLQDRSRHQERHSHCCSSSIQAPARNEWIP